MPHVNIKYFPVAISEEQESELVDALAGAITEAFGCDKGVISIALEPVDTDSWHEQVYLPEVVERKNLLVKKPNY